MLAFGQSASANAKVNIEVPEDLLDGHNIVMAIRDRIPEFGKAWSIVADAPSLPDIERMYYFSSGFCCQLEIYPDTHLAGPIPEGMVRAQEEHALVDRLKAEELEQWQDLADESRQHLFDRIQDRLEKDRP